jgi:rubrerythrin
VSVTEYLTDHTGRKIAFFYYIDSERYRTCPQLVWKCRDYPSFKGTCASKAEFVECAKQVLKELKKNRSLPVCNTCGLTSPKMEAQDTCPDCLTDE